MSNLGNEMEKFVIRKDFPLARLGGEVRGNLFRYKGQKMVVKCNNETITSTIYELTAQKCALLTNNTKPVFRNPYSIDTLSAVLPSPLECIHLKLPFYDSSRTIIPGLLPVHCLGGIKMRPQNRPLASAGRLTAVKCHSCPTDTIKSALGCCPRRM
ncbi:hypothetical protein CDAR_509821 [Caerostris darwini]|uniref:Uncharacterized protein n=1 Tax=Caerostris darwini TaxID=1538125 RepID=A0AAV4QJA4_9ARAC|nr:hypothetical protein CDAR_509821 [Caerostris darwini]